MMKINPGITTDMPAGFRDRFRLASDYLRFRLQARSRFTIHSPFLFDLVNEVFRDTRHFYAFDEIEKLRHQLLADATVINENHHGEKSKVLADGNRRVKDVAAATSISPEYGEMLFRLVNHFRPANVLELGSGTGISALYLASAAAPAPVITLEGSQMLCRIAEEQFKKLKLKNVKAVEGSFSDTLPKAIKELGTLHFIFIDGDHRKSSLLDYFNQCLPHLGDDAVVVIDDIYWSEEMKEAWNKIINQPEVTMSIDLFRMGILFFRQGIVKQHLKVVLSI